VALEIPRELLRIFTGLGDPTLLILGGLGLFLHLWSNEKQRALAGSWAVAFVLCVLLTATSKLVFYLIAGSQQTSVVLRSPSGHAAIATGFYGCFALMLAAGRSQAVRTLLCVGTATLVGTLAASRFMLELHTVPEVAAGLAIGVLSVAIFIVRMNGVRPVVLNVGQLAALLILIGVAHSSRIDGEALIRQLTQQIAVLPSAEATYVMEWPAKLAAQLGATGNH
jgi:membrane-associated phospholipid phosphatase